MENLRNVLGNYGGYIVGIFGVICIVAGICLVISGIRDKARDKKESEKPQEENSDENQEALNE